MGNSDTDLLDVYKEICLNIKVTDEISFKLLATVPLISGVGSGALALLEKTDLLRGLTEFAVILFSLIGLVLTWGLFLWELRNIQKCKWLISRAAILEQYFAAPLQQFNGVQPKDMDAETMKDLKEDWWLKPREQESWGKTEAEKLIYYAAALVWFIPLLIAVHGLIGADSEGAAFSRFLWLAGLS